jgi:molybdopterin-binding protein
VKKGTVMAEVVVDVLGQEVVAVITASSAEELSLAEDDQVTVLFKATEVMIGKSRFGRPHAGLGGNPQST